MSYSDKASTIASAQLGRHHELAKTCREAATQAGIIRENEFITHSELCSVIKKMGDIIQMMNNPLTDGQEVADTHHIINSKGEVVGNITLLKKGTT